MQTRLLVVSFDAMNTIMSVHGGIGAQYRKALVEFVVSHLATPNASTLSPFAAALGDVIQHSHREASSNEDTRTSVKRGVEQLLADDCEFRRISGEIIREEAKRQMSTLYDLREKLGDRSVPSLPEAAAPWHSYKEVPMGGLTAASVKQFWATVLSRVYVDAGIYRLDDAAPAGPPSPCSSESQEPVAPSTPPSPALETARVQCRTLLFEEMRAHVARAGVLEMSEDTYVVESLAENSDPFLRFLHNTIYERFGSASGYHWLPEGYRTLQQLRTWRLQQLHHRQPTASDPTDVPPLQERVAERDLHLPRPPLLLVPPFIVTNSDERVMNIMEELLVNTEAEGALLSRPFIIAQTIGAAKPSSAGLHTCVQRTLEALQTMHWEKGDEAYGATFSSDDITHLHVGDSPVDEAAVKGCAHDCRYVKCHKGKGIVWEDLLAAIQSLT